MKRNFLTIITLVLISSFTKAQKPIDELIAAEKKFAETSKILSPRKAFLSFVDSNCVSYNNGERINVFQEWINRKEDSSKLIWAPEFAIVSAAGDLGVTTGPWEYHQGSLQEAPSAHGYFTSIWKKGDNNKWKVVYDMGTSFAQKFDTPLNVEKITTAARTKIDFPSHIDFDFIDAFGVDKNYAIKKFITTNSWFNVNGYPPLKDSASIEAGKDIISEKLKFSSPANLLVAASNDMLAVYGTARNGDKLQSYMRLWVRKDDAWKLLIMVLH